MSIEIPESAAEVENRAKTDVQRELVESNPFLKNSWLEGNDQDSQSIILKANCNSVAFSLPIR